MRYFFIIVLMFISISACAYASPCDCIGRSNIPDSQKEVLAPNIGNQLKEDLASEAVERLQVEKINILQSFKFGE